jgi:hypothetical protein
MAEQVVVKFVNGGCSCCDPPSHSGGGLEISGSVGRGGRNSPADVKAIQAALNEQDPADGGPTLKLAVDGIVGPLTMAAIQKFQTRQLGWADGRVDPDGPTLHRLQGASTAQKGKKPKPAPPPKATAEQNKAFVERIGGLLPQARHWIATAQMKMDFAVDYLNKSHSDPSDPFSNIGHAEYALMNKYFHLDKLSRHEQGAAIAAIRRIYDLIIEVITESLLSSPMFGWGVGYFQPDPADGTLAANAYVAYTFFGGWHRRRKDGKPRLSGDDNYAGDKTLREDTVFFPVGSLLTKSDRFMIETIIHELAHFVGPGGPHNGERIADYTYDINKNFLTVDAWTARHTADIYGYFAAEAALRTITIPLV